MKRFLWKLDAYWIQDINNLYLAQIRSHKLEMICCSYWFLLVSTSLLHGHGVLSITCLLHHLSWMHTATILPSIAMEFEALPACCICHERTLPEFPRLWLWSPKHCLLAASIADTLPTFCRSTTRRLRVLCIIMRNHTPQALLEFMQFVSCGLNLHASLHSFINDICFC